MVSSHPKSIGIPRVDRLSTGPLDLGLHKMGQFGLHYKGQAQGTLGCLVATLSLLSRVIES